MIFLLLMVSNMFAPLTVHAGFYPCSILNDPKTQVEQSLIITVAEESFGTTGTEAINQDTDIIQCFRQTTCTLDKDKKINCENVQFVDSCTPSLAQGKDSQVYCQRVQAFIAKSGAGLLYAYIGQVYRWAAGTIGIVCVLFIVVGGIQITTSGDNSEGMNQAKERIVQSISGLVLLFLSAVILYTINPNFFTIQ